MSDDTPESTSPVTAAASSPARPWYLNAPYLLTCLVVAGIGFWAGPHLVRWYRGQTQTVELMTGDRVTVSLRGDEATRGPADALVTIIEFSDFECPFCARAAEPLFDAATGFPDDVRIIFKHFPLSGHRNAVPAAHAAWAATNQGKFWDLHDWLYEQRGDLTRLPGQLDALGLDKDRFAADLEAAETAAVIDSDRLAAGVAGVTSTPSFFVNGHLYRGVMGSHAWETIIEAELAAASELVASGVARADVYATLMKDAKLRFEPPRAAEGK